jgi:hypothetical protein
MVTVDKSGRPSLLPATAHGAEKTSDPIEIPRPVAPAPTPARRLVMSKAAQKMIGGHAVVYLPAGFWMLDDGAYDLVVHFHGGAQILNPQLDAGVANVVLVTVNLGIGSRAYSERFADPRALDQALDAVDEVVAERGPSKKAHRRRLALSAWSAGYGALQQILSREQNLAHIDALFLLDGLHGSLAKPHSREVAPVSMDAFVRFARLAAAGKKDMVVTHSAIETYDYASTTETARYLVGALALPTCPQAPEPGDMVATDCHARGSLRVHGYAGNDAPAHCQHVRQWKSLVLEPLGHSWQKPRAHDDRAAAVL